MLRGAECPPGTWDAGREEQRLLGLQLSRRICVGICRTLERTEVSPKPKVCRRYQPRSSLEEGGDAEAHPLPLDPASALSRLSWDPVSPAPD